MEIITKINSFLNEIVWGSPLIILLICTGIYLTVGTSFIQFTKIKFIFKETIGSLFKKKKSEKKTGDISSFQALNVALGGTVGVGNIAGVATAIALGGPGAVFWMWISGLIGMAIKFSEVTLSLKFRVRQFNAPMMGGPMMYIRRGMGKKYLFLAGIFAFLASISALGIGNMVQANSVAEGTLQFGIPRHITGIILVFAVGLVTVGGIKRIANVAMFCVPFMTFLYFITGIVIILVNYSHIPNALKLIFSGAFSTTSAAGGFAGASFSQAIKYGMARGIFSNEAALGSAPIAHATAKVNHPVQQGLWGILEVLIDTIIICSITAFAILVTGVWTDGKTGALLTMSAYESVFGKYAGFTIVVLSMILTAYDTNLAWCFYGETCASYLLGKNVRKFYRIIWLPFVLIGAMGKLEIIWSIADTLNGLMAVPNLIALFVLGGIVFSITKDYFKSYNLKKYE